MASTFSSPSSSPLLHHTTKPLNTKKSLTPRSISFPQNSSGRPMLVQALKRKDAIGGFQEHEDSYKRHLSVHGLSKDDINLTVEKRVLDVLVIKGKHKDDDILSDRYISYYNLLLPEKYEKRHIKAELKEGELIITVPKPAYDDDSLEVPVVTQ